MIRRVRVGVRCALPDEILRHLDALGLAPDPEGPIVVRFTPEDAEIAAVVFEDDSAALPWRPLARRLAASGPAPVVVVRVEAEAWRASDEVWSSGRTTAESWSADGSRTTTEHAVDPFGPEGDDAAWDEPADAADWLADTLLTTHFGPHGRPETLTRYRQVTHPDPWLEARLLVAADTTWADIPVDGSCAAYLAWRLGDRLDVTAAAPDLSLWTHRLLRRYGSATAPGYEADWERLTEAERARPSADPRCVPAWKILAGDAVLTAAEVAIVTTALAPEAAPVGHVVPVAWAETVVGLRGLVGAVVVRRVGPPSGPP